MLAMSSADATAWRADQQLLAIALDVAGADVGVVAFQRRDQVVEGELVGRQALGLRRNQVLLGMATDAVDLGHPGYIAQLRLDDPVWITRKSVGV